LFNDLFGRMNRADEENIWKEFLQIITNIENPQLIYYGSYETVFLRRLKKRYGDTAEDGGSLVHGLMKSAQNVLSVMYGRGLFSDVFQRSQGHCILSRLQSGQLRNPRASEA